MANIGDYVRFLNDVGGGRITKINGQTAYVTDEDGFETPVLLRECVVVPADNPAETAKIAKAKSPAVIETLAPTVAETPEGEKLTAVIIFEPHDIKRLSTTDFDALLVNDSNYHLLYSVAVRESADKLWTPFAAGTVEPGTQILLDEIAHDDLPSLERLSVQLIAYKPSKAFEIKAPAAIEVKIDNTRFAKLHCFSKSEYSPVPVITLPFVEADKVNRPLNLAEALESSAPKVKTADRTPKATPQPKKAADEVPVVDLHIDSLIDSTAGLSHVDILNRQIEEFHRQMKQIHKRPGSKIIFIHGKGEGVLRHAILEQIRRYYPKCETQDASFREYGFGATQITVH